MNSADQQKVLAVHVVPCTIRKGRFRWHVVEGEGPSARHTTTASYATEAEARRAGEAAMREMRKRPFVGRDD
jgi:hypothetical protein